MWSRITSKLGIESWLQSSLYPFLDYNPGLISAFCNWLQQLSQVSPINIRHMLIDKNFKETQKTTKNTAVSRRWAVPAVACPVTPPPKHIHWLLLTGLKMLQNSSLDVHSFTNSTYVEWHHLNLSSSVEEVINSLYVVYEVSSSDT